MTTRCKNGDLAVVLHDDLGCEGNVGRLVEVHGPSTSTRYPDQTVWYIRQLDPHAQWFVSECDCRIAQEWLTWGSRVTHPDAWLLPVRPGETEEAIEEVAEYNQDQILETKV